MPRPAGPAHPGRVFITGGSSGIGLGIARRFEAAGATVHVTGTRASASDYDEGGGLDGLVFHSLDVADDAAVRSFSEAFGDLAVLVSSVGTVAYGGREYDIDTFRQVRILVPDLAHLGARALEGDNQVAVTI